MLNYVVWFLQQIFQLFQFPSIPNVFSFFFNNCKLQFVIYNFKISKEIFEIFLSYQKFLKYVRFFQKNQRHPFFQSLSRDEMFGNEVQTTRESLSVLLLSSFDALQASGPIYNLVFDQLADLQDHGILQQPLSLCKAYISRDWCRFSRVFHRLSRIQQLSVEPFVPTIRKVII